MSIGRFLQDERIKKNLTVDEVAAKAKVSIGTVRACEQGTRNPSAKSLKALLFALDVEDSTWIDTITWQNPSDGIVYDLAPMKGGWKKDTSKEMANNRSIRSDPSIALSVIRIEAIKSILKADTNTVLAIITLLTNSSSQE